MIPNLIRSGKNNSDRGIKNAEKTIMAAEEVFPCVICQRRIIKPQLIKDNEKHRETQ